MLLITILTITIIVFIGLIVYSEFMKPNIADEVEEFVSNVTISNGKTNEKKEKDSIQEKSANKKYSHDLNDWIPYESVDDNAKIMSQKFKDLIEARKRAGEDIDI